MPMRTPTTDDFLRKEAVDLATDTAALLLEYRREVPPERAYALAMECVRIADRIQGARREALPAGAARRFGEAWLAAVRSLTGLDRIRARTDLPEARAEALHRRLHLLALALGALARQGRD
jgi:hypothetical protein